MKRAIAAAALVVAATIGLILLLAPGSGDSAKPRTDKDQQAAQAWEKQVGDALSLLVRDMPDIVTGAREWQAGQRDTDLYSHQIDGALNDVLATRDKVAAVKPLAKAPEAATLYRQSADLYVEAVRVYGALVRTPPGDLRSQVDLLARRVRELADRIFDRGKAVLAPLLKEQPDPNVEVRLPEEVPDWVAEGLAAGPPLEDPPPPAAANPPLRQKTRPEESEGTWIAAVQRMAIPSDAALARAIDGRDTGALRTVAGLLVRFSEQLRAEPDPKGGRETSARVRLSLLVDADAARAAQVAALEGDGDAAARLSRTARRLALTGDDLWWPRLGARATGFDRAVLAEVGP